MENVQKLMKAYQEAEDTSIFSQIRELIQTEDGLFSVLARVTNNFYMGTENGRPAAFLFTSQEYADAFVKEMKWIGVETRSLEIRPDQRIAFFNDLYRSGFEAVVLDKNRTSLAMSLFNIIEKPKAEDNLVVNPELMRAAIRFYQGLASHHVIKEMQDLVCAELYRARFLYPEGKTPAILTDKKGIRFCPVFTDPVEFGKFDKKRRFRGTVIKFRDFKKILGNADGIVVNPFGFGLKLDREKLDRIESENRKLKIVK